MDGILPILMVIISVLSVISKVQKQKQEAKKKAGAFRDAPAAKIPEKEAAVSSVPLAPAAPVFPSFEPAPAVMGAEGEDACHEYMLPDQDEAETGASSEETQDARQAQELVRGVILSEILARPRGMGRRRA